MASLRSPERAPLVDLLVGTLRLYCIGRDDQFFHYKVQMLLTISDQCQYRKTTCHIPKSSSMTTVVSSCLESDLLLMVLSFIAESQASRHELLHVHHPYFAAVRHPGITGISYSMLLSHSDTAFNPLRPHVMHPISPRYL